jgi:5-methylcytosine-specific restriction protein A
MSDVSNLVNVRFVVGDNYTRNDITRALGLEAKPTGDWLTGYHREGDEMFIFAAVDATGRTGHDYQNQWLRSDRFLWFGTTGSKRTDAKIAPMLSREVTTHIFWRSGDRDPFTYAGIGVPVSVVDSVPIQIVWDVVDPDAPDDSRLPEELDQVRGLYPVAAGRQVMVNKYERSRRARRDCIAHYGAACMVCDFDFSATYGSIGNGYIHVHHLLTMAELAKRYEATGVPYVLDPVRDLRPVCANCHAMIHTRVEPYSIEDLRAILRRRRSNDVVAE